MTRRSNNRRRSGRRRLFKQTAEYPAQVSAHAALRWLERCCGFADEIATEIALNPKRPDLEILEAVLKAHAPDLTPKKIEDHILTPSIMAAIEAGAMSIKTPNGTLCIQNRVVCTILEPSMAVVKSSFDRTPTPDYSDMHESQTQRHRRLRTGRPSRDEFHRLKRSANE